jgi:nitrate/nitrite transporter NarK
MFLVGRLSEFIPLLFLTFIVGSAGGGVHISMTTLPMAWFEKDKLGGPLGIVTGGGGIGIVLTGLLLPYLLSSLGTGAWRACWMILALLTFVVGLISYILLKERPSHTDLPSLQVSPRTVAPSARSQGSSVSLPVIFLIYFIFGFAYNLYVTYYVAFLIEEVHLTDAVAGAIWSVFGWMCVVSGWIWGFLSDRMGRRDALLWNNGLISLSVLIPLLFHQIFLLGFSAFLFGATFFGMVTVVAACVGDQRMEKRAALYGWVTLLHGIGQFLGTLLGGYLRDLTGSFQMTLLVSLVGFVACIVIAGLNKGGERSLSPPSSNL